MAVVHEAQDGIGLDELEDELTRAFETVLAAVERDEPVVLCVDDAHLQASDDVVRAALAHGLLGLARAVAFEGRKPGWSVAVLAAAADTPPEERERWAARLADGGAASGALLRLGGEHLGRVPS